ncbi:MAG TPA: Gfo/Idh/MocA family oxidoreductase [Flavitalea sp.]|nr:Gfo/Idh/MocA family oxidoreductase [Flavitalea sp.]
MKIKCISSDRIFSFVKFFLFWTTVLSVTNSISQPSSIHPLRVAIAGTTHGHAGWILGKKDTSSVIVVGIYEPNETLTARQAKQYNLSEKLFYRNLDEMLSIVKPEAVVAFGSIFDHLAVVRACAPKGIHVMVEKPLAVSLDHARQMEALAKKYGIHLLTNYETSWYPTTVKTYELVHDSNFVGAIRKTVIHDGHEGPKEIGVSKEFFEWLTDPVKNGGGALIDFGCYGANLMTYLMKGEVPRSVTAVTKQFKPDIYPKVDDDATIIVNYAHAECIIQASWNWPFGRKDMEVYGENGYIIAVNNQRLRLRGKSDKQENSIELKQGEVKVFTDPFVYLEAVVRKKILPQPHDVYSLENNMTVVRILEAARQSAKSGKTVRM